MKNEKGITIIPLLIIVTIILMAIGGVTYILISNSKEREKEVKSENLNDISIIEDDEETSEEPETSSKENLITNDFEINYRSKILNDIEYGSNLQMEDDSYKLLTFKASKYDLPLNLYDYREDILVRLTYSEDDYKVVECKVLNKSTNKIIKDLSEENIEKLFNIEYDKTIIEKEWTEEINLSEFKENEIYKYVATETTQFPKINNDIEKNCIIYIKESNGFSDNSYEKKLNMYDNIKGNTVSISYNEYKEDDFFTIMYKTAETEEILKLIEDDEIIHLSKFNSGDKLEYKFEDYIYNDTDTDITLKIEDKAFGVEMSDEITIPSEKIYGFSWQIESVTIK